jgi:hypothetical protein
MPFVLLFIILALFSNMANSLELSVRTQGTGFYLISQQNDGVDLSEVTGDIKHIQLQNVDGITPLLLRSNKKSKSTDNKIIFFSEILHGKDTYQHPLDDNNGYVLSLTDKKNKHKKWLLKNKKTRNLPLCQSIRTTDHLESNDLMIRVNTYQYKQTPELWYWKKISQINKKGFSIPLDFSKAETQKDISIKVAFRAMNRDQNIKNIPHHEVQVIFNGHKISTLNWQDKTQYLSNSILLPKEFISEAENQLTFFIPKRMQNKKKILDVVMLDYVDVDFSIKTTEITDGFALYSPDKCQIKLDNDQLAYSTLNKKYALKSIALTADDRVYIGQYDSLHTAHVKSINPLALQLDKIDYLMISHPLFIDTIQALADYYRQKNMQVAVVNVNDIYDHYAYGVRELYAIKNFIKDIHSSGNGKLQHVLLVGDSSWDWRDNKKYLDKYASWANRRLPVNSNFTSQKHFKYNNEIQNRDFVPTGQFHSAQGHSASDNWFVSIIPESNHQGEDYIPDIAIGRFTAATVAEAQVMVQKSIDYQTKSKVGPWKSRVLWITNASKVYQNYSKSISKRIGNLGVVAENIFPKEMDGDNLKVQETLTEAINYGDLIVHFLGHGGNSIWRIGPPDVKKNRDLFTLDHISSLNNKSNLPFVMSMSCYSAPYDHPFADSIGEKFFREKDKGAIAVLAASWRNAPNQMFSRAVIDNIYKTPRQSLGQAILNAKRHYQGRVSVEMYNLLGDPALHLAIPALTMKTEADMTQNKVNVEIDSSQFKGQVKVSFVDDSSEVIDEQQFNIDSNSFTIPLNDKNKRCNQARIYAWDSDQNIDAMASFTCLNANVK